MQIFWLNITSCRSLPLQLVTSIYYNYLLASFHKQDTDVHMHGSSQELVPSWANFKLLCKEIEAIFGSSFGE